MLMLMWIAFVFRQSQCNAEEEEEINPSMLNVSMSPMKFSRWIFTDLYHDEEMNFFLKNETEISKNFEKIVIWFHGSNESNW